MSLTKRLLRLQEWTRRYPPFVRHAVYGAAFVLFLIGARGGLIAAPILAIAIALTSDHPALDLARCLGVVAMTIVGGAFSGIAYGAAQRWIAPLPRIGRGLSGIVTVAPYMFLASTIARRVETNHWLGPIKAAKSLRSASAQCFSASS